MPRLPRLILPGVPLHLVQRGNNRLPVFLAREDYEDYRHALRSASRRYQCDVHAYALMTNHVHLLITPRDADSPPRMMQALGRRYVRRFNDRHQRTGTLWEGRFRSMLIDSEAYFLACSRYVELNPVRAGIVTRPDDYPWTSYRHNALGESDPLITVNPLYDRLGDDPADCRAAYRALFDREPDPEELDTIRRGTERGAGVTESSAGDLAHALLVRLTRTRGGDRRSPRFRHAKGLFQLL